MVIFGPFLGVFGPSKSGVFDLPGGLSRRGILYPRISGYRVIGVWGYRGYPQKRPFYPFGGGSKIDQNVKKCQNGKKCKKWVFGVFRFWVYLGLEGLSPIALTF